MMNDGRMNNAMGNGFGMEIGSGDVVRFNILERIGRLSHNDKSGWSKEVNIVAWNDYPPKVDIREWDPNHERMSRGVTLHELEAVKLANMLLKKFPPEEYANNKYQNKGARNRSASGGQGYGNRGGRNYSNGNGSNANGQGYGSGSRNYSNGSGQVYGNSGGRNYANSGGQSDHYANGGGAQGDQYSDCRSEDANLQEFGLMGDGKQRYQACGDAGELYEDYILGLDAAMPGDEDVTGKAAEGYAGSDYEALYDSGEVEPFDDEDGIDLNGAGAEKCDIESERIDEELEAEGSATPRGNFQSEGSDEADDEEVEPF